MTCKTRRGDGRARTGDPLLAKQVLSQLSYAPMISVGTAVRCGGRGPFWIRTRDLTVISRALSPTELKARGARPRSDRARAGTPHDRPPRRVMRARRAHRGLDP